MGHLTREVPVHWGDLPGEPPTRARAIPHQDFLEVVEIVEAQGPLGALIVAAVANDARPKATTT